MILPSKELTVAPEQALVFNNTQPFFSEMFFKKIMNPLFKAMQIGTLSEIYDPSAQIISEYEFMSLEFSDYVPSNEDQFNSQNKIYLTYVFHYNPIIIKHNSQFRKLMPNITYQFYQPLLLDYFKETLFDASYVDKNFFKKKQKINYTSHFPFNEFLILRKDLAYYFNPPSLLNIKLSLPYLAKRHLQTALAYNYRFLSITFYDFAKLEYDPYLSHYKLVRKNQRAFSNSQKVLLFPINKFEKR